MTHCERCGVTAALDDSTTVRVLWGHDFLRITLCDDCNGYVQGPANLDIETGNRPEQPVHRSTVPEGYN